MPEYVTRRDVLVEGDQSGMAQRGTGCRQAGRGERHVECAGGEETPQGAAHLEGGQLTAVLQATAQFGDDAPQRGAHGDLVHSRPGEPLREADQFRAGLLRCSAPGVGIAAPGHDPGDGRECLDVVHHRRRIPQPTRGRVRRARPGAAPVPFQTGDQRRLLTGHVRSGALHHLDVEGGVRAVHGGSEVPLDVGFPGRFPHACQRLRILRADQHHRPAGAAGETGQRQALQHPPRVGLHQQPVGVRPGVPLVAVGHHDGAGRPAGRLPLGRHPEARSPTSAQPGGGHLPPDPVGIAGRHGPRPHLPRRFTGDHACQQHGVAGVVGHRDLRGGWWLAPCQLFGERGSRTGRDAVERGRARVAVPQAPHGLQRGFPAR